MSSQTIQTALQAADSPLLITSGAELARAAKSWRRSEVLGIDTEFLRQRTYRAAFGLFQVSDGASVWLVDPLAVPSLEPIAELLGDESITKLLHGSSEDLEVFVNYCGLPPSPFIDTQVACAMLGRPLQMGYHAAMDWLLDVHIDKDQTRTNWLKRPLTSKQIRYAALDVCLLPEAWRRLRERLVDHERMHWLEEECRRMADNALKPVDEAAAWQRVRGAFRLDADDLGVLAVLAKWREHEAQRRDRARGFIVPDSVLMTLAQRRPTKLHELQSMDDLHPGAFRRYGEELLALVRNAGESATRIDPPQALTPAQKRTLRKMKREVNSLAAELDVDPALLASKRELETFIRQNGDGHHPPERFLGWRKPLVTQRLEAALEDAEN